jgi:hypothetical protein
MKDQRFVLLVAVVATVFCSVFVVYDVCFGFGFASRRARLEVIRHALRDGMSKEQVASICSSTREIGYRVTLVRGNDCWRLHDPNPVFRSYYTIVMNFKSNMLKRVEVDHGGEQETSSASATTNTLHD